MDTDIPVQRLQSVNFRFYSSAEIKALSVKEITNSQTFDNLQHPSIGGLYDPALGPTDKDDLCGTCCQNFVHCPGHMGHIQLPFPVYNPVYFKTMFKASTNGFQSLFLASKRESLLMTTKSMPEASAVTPDSISTDFNSQYLVDTFTSLDSFVPFFVSGDGNCLFNSISVALYGNELYAEELRVKTCIEMVLNQEKYTAHPEYSNFLLLSPSYEESCIDCSTSGNYSSVWTLMAVAEVIGRPINSVYPGVNGYNDLAYQTLNTVFKPTSGPECSSDPVYIMWTRSCFNSGKLWIPNHFVPLIRVNSASSVDVMSDDESNDYSSDCQYVEIDNSYENDNNVRTENDKDKGEITMSDPDEYSDNDDDTTEIGCPILNSLEKIPLEHWLSVNDIFRKICESKNVFEDVPNGIKNNVCMLVDNKRNFIRKQNGQKSEYYDDCGIWDYKKGKTVTTKFIVGNSLTHTELKKGIYCYKKRQNGKVIWVPFEPQPEVDEIIVLHRYYTTLKADPEYQRLVSWISSESHEELSYTAVYQYRGIFPKKRAAHGNSESVEPYARTNPKTMEKIGLGISVKPRKLYYKLQKEDPLNAPRSFKQIKDKKYREEKKVKSKPQYNNLADELLQVIGMCGTHPFVKRIIHDENRIPSIILYTNDQISDLKHLLTSESVKKIGIDRTFNVGALFLTFLVYKNIRVVRNDTKDYPVFFGPMMLHKDASYETYRSFLSHISAVIEKDIDVLEIRQHRTVSFGTDEEIALTKAVDATFPNATRLLCTKHLKDNIKHHLTEKTTLKSKEKMKVIDKMFGNDGIVNANNSFEFETKSSQFKQSLGVYPEFEHYYEKHLKSKLRKFVNEPRRENTSEDLWTNNNAESMNNIIKQDIDWKPKSIPTLVQILYEAVDLQFVDLRSALHGQGNYRLHTNYKKFYVDDVIWKTKGEDKRHEIFQKFLKMTVKRQPQEIVSKDGTFKIPVAARGVAKKPYQRKRPRSEKTSRKY